MFKKHLPLFSGSFAVRNGLRSPQMRKKTQMCPARFILVWELSQHAILSLRPKCTVRFAAQSLRHKNPAPYSDRAGFVISV